MEEREARIKASPGGLDPIEVMESLPAEMREAFESQEVHRLQEVAAKMDIAVFQNHLDRCIKSGLWLPEGGKQQQPENGDDQNGNDEP
jgi:cell division cycle protein 37